MWRNCLACAFLFALGCSDSPIEPLADFGNCDPTVTGAWTHIGLDSQDVTALAETPWGLFAGTSRSGVFRCGAETGNRWRSLGSDHAIVSSLLFVPGSTPRLLVGVRPRAEEKTDAAVFATEDRGQTWLPWDGGLAARHGNRQWTYSLTMAPSNPQRLFMGQSLPILRSDDGGSTWDYVLGSPTFSGLGMNSIVISPDRDGRIWGGGEGALFNALVVISTDWGDTWKPVIPFLGFENAVFDLAVDRGNTARLWAAMRGGVARSNDFGESWSFVLAVDDVIVFSLVTNGDRLHAVGAKFPPPDLFPTDLALFTSRDGGDTWTAEQAPADAGGSGAAILDVRGGLLIGTSSDTRGGVWRFQP